MSILGSNLPPSTIEKLSRSAIRRENVFCINMNREDGITPKDGYSSRNKYFVVLGLNSHENVCGGVVFNTNINPNLAADIKNMHIPIAYEKYDFLSHECFVDCSCLKMPTYEKIWEGKYLGDVDEEDLRRIIAKIKESAVESRARMRLFQI